jgi:thermitase
MHLKQVLPTPRRWTTCTLMVLAAVTLSLPSITSAARPETVQILLHPRAGTSELVVQRTIGSAQGRQVDQIPQLDVRVIEIPAHRADILLASLQRNPNVEYAEWNLPAEIAEVSNAPLYEKQWHHPVIASEGAWSYTTGCSGVTLAILDTGINADHPDLAGRVLPGYDFVNKTSDTTDFHGHGTAVAGAAAAAGDNALGVAGMNWAARILPVKVIDVDGGTSSTIAQGITYAADEGARVLNISVVTGASKTLERAVNYAWNRDCVIIAGAGNSGGDRVFYPAGYANVLAVTATAMDGSLASFATTGKHIPLAAPGVGIWTTHANLETGHAARSGTSYSSPLTAGVASLIASRAPSLSNQEIIEVILGSSAPSAVQPYPVLNAYEAVGTAALLADSSGDAGQEEPVSDTEPVTKTKGNKGGGGGDDTKSGGGTGKGNNR